MITTGSIQQHQYKHKKAWQKTKDWKIGTLTTLGQAFPNDIQKKKEHARF